MPAHTLARSTQTLAMVQLDQVNQRLGALTEAGEQPVTAERLGLMNSAVEPRVIDRAAMSLLGTHERRTQATLFLPAKAPLRSLLAAGDPAWPHIYGVFQEVVGRRRLPVPIREEHLRRISRELGLAGHCWD